MNKKSRQIILIVIGAVVMCCVVGTLSVLFSPTSNNDVALETANTFMQAIFDKDYSLAVSLMAPSLQSEIGVYSDEDLRFWLAINNIEFSDWFLSALVVDYDNSGSYIGSATGTFDDGQMQYALAVYMRPNNMNEMSVIGFLYDKNTWGITPNP